VFDTDNWQVHFLDGTGAHRIAQGDGVTVAVIDSGVDARHPDLAGSVLPGYNPAGVGSADGTSDSDGHGTAMALLIAGHGTVKGIAPKAKIMPIRSSDTTSMVKAIDWAVEHGVGVINISAGHAIDVSDVSRSVSAALAAGVVIVASAGNLPNSSAVEYPAAYAGVIAAAAVTRTGQRASISVTGIEVVLAAPGEDITTVDAQGQPRHSSGTSDASALIAGVAALVKAKFPNLTGREIYHRLVMTADDRGAPGRDPEYGYGIVNPVRALTAEVPPLVESPSPNADGNPGSPRADAGDGGRLPATAVVVVGLIVVAVLVLVGVLMYNRSRAKRRSGLP
jgi:type VII secretion-associated serine protease mycosin